MVHRPSSAGVTPADTYASRAAALEPAGARTQRMRTRRRRDLRTLPTARACPRAGAPVGAPGAGRISDILTSRPGFTARCTLRARGVLMRAWARGCGARRAYLRARAELQLLGLLACAMPASRSAGRARPASRSAHRGSSPVIGHGKTVGGAYACRTRPSPICRNCLSPVNLPHRKQVFRAQGTPQERSG
ncbi:hypothetical protein BV25DRAFT_971872 [Artomyces pyxidatus]|uniref:Uncharacterized protein n=1 Tax=Artomyces pyxidatus TaxID=48021 RepID=A0ACB8SUW6_9AGAM|nr:hypothetical protein BV25DRAFT_971872 [Artomyces pyxidatus]